MEKEKVKMNIYQKMQKMRVELQEKGLEKSGKNSYSNYDYFELSNFLPQINKLQEENSTFSFFEIDKENAQLSILNCENTSEVIKFEIPVAELSLKGANAIQNIGGLTTYCRRYLYMIAFEIAENDEFDRNENNNPQPQTPTLYVDEIKIKVLKDKIVQKGVDVNKILERYHVLRMEDLTVQNFTKALEILDKMPDVQEVDLGL